MSETPGRHTGPQCRLFTCPEPHAFQAGSDAALDGQFWYRRWAASDSPGLVISGLPLTPPTAGELVQQTSADTPAELCRLFNAHWFPIWSRETRQASQDVWCWEGFLHSLPSPPDCAEIQLDLAEPSVWRASLRRLRPGKAPGVCGCHSAELKAMPAAVLRDLITVFLQVIQRGGLPPHLCRGRVSSVPKTERPQSIQQCRPIAVYSTLYRPLASTIARQTLLAWGGGFRRGSAERSRGVPPGTCPSPLNFRSKSLSPAKPVYWAFPWICPNSSTASRGLRPCLPCTCSACPPKP